jgi:AcrR family transcriptional regulator
VTSPRRERARANTVAEIKAAALSQIAASGGGSLSIRGVARAIDMSPAGLYRYYDGLDALLTELITDAYTDLAVAVEEAVGGGAGTSGQRFEAGVMAYRAWALENRNRFLLIFGTPIPGYAAPEGGPTVEANRRIGAAFLGVAAQGWAQGEIGVPTPTRPPSPEETGLAAEVANAVPGFPPEMIPVLIGTWAHFHGLVTLEVLDQLDWLYPDAEPFFRGEVGRMLEALRPAGTDSSGVGGPTR